MLPFRPWRSAVLSLALLSAITFSGLAWSAPEPVPENGPQPPCGSEPSPSFPEVDKQPATRFWDGGDLGRDWTPPACVGWTTRGFSTLVVTAGRFRSTIGAEGIRRRIGAISEFQTVLYWSTTRKQWQPLIVDAYAMTGPEKGKRRGDFSSNEISEGSVFYYQQADNLSGKANYKMEVVAASPDRVVFKTENISTMRYLLVPLFHPGDLQSIYFIEQESNDIWRYYSIARTGRNSSKLLNGHAASSVNRAVAFYRLLAGIPMNMEPPAAR